MERLIETLTNRVQLSAVELDFLRKTAFIRKASKGELLLSEGEVSKAFYFIEKGCVRLFYLADGEEKTAFFYTEGMFVSSYESFTKGKPAQHNLAAVEPCEFVVFHQNDVEKYLGFSPKFEALARIMMEEELSVYQSMISSFVTMNAEERYLKLLENQPALADRIPQYQLATYLGVSAETLSRIRKRIVSK